VREFECNSNHPVLGRPCNKAFSGLATLRRHNRSIHEQTKIYHCTLCPVKKFSTTQGFSHHMKVQHPTDSTMYKDKTYCPICPGKAFSRKDTLALHTKRFHANKIYHCTLCPVRKFSTTQGFSHHMKVQHPTDSTMYKNKTYCPICPGKAFSRKDTLALHTKRFHANKKRQR
jgi:ferredoxin-like protein FixX